RYLYRVRALNTSGETSLSNVVTADLSPAGQGMIDFSEGFPFTGHNLVFNGTPTPSLIIDPGYLNVTNGGDFGQATSPWWANRVPIGNFTTSFTFRLHDGTDPRADGFAFVIQADPRGTSAIGPAGGGLGYGPDQPTGGLGVVNSVAIKFDLYQNVSEGT